MSSFVFDSGEVVVQVTPQDELERRAARLQTLMREAELDGVMATQNASVFYFSGVIQQAQVYIPVEGSPLLLVRKHHGRAVQTSQLGGTLVVGVRSLRQLPGLITEAGGKRPNRIGFELDVLPVTVFNAYAKALGDLQAELVDAGMVVRQSRMIKSEYELEQIRHAAKVADIGLQAAAKAVREGVTELEAASQVEAATRAAGHSGIIRMRAYGQEMHMGHLLAGESGALPSFMNSPTGGFGPGPWAPYGASTRKLRKGEPIFLDYTGEWGGYIADQTRMLSIGTLSQFWLDAYAAMREVQIYVEKTVRPGTTSGEFYDIAVRKAEELGYGEYFMGPGDEESPGQRVPFVGHAVGLELDEWPPLQAGTTTVLEEGMVLAFEPKLIYRQGAIGIEDTYRLTAQGLEPLTISTREIITV